MKKVSIWIGIVTAAFLLFCVIWVSLFRGTLVVTEENRWLPAGGGWQQVTEEHLISMDTEGIVEAEEIRLHENYAQIRLRAVKTGVCDIYFGTGEDTKMLAYCKVTEKGFLVVDGAIVGGVEGCCTAAGVYLLLICLIFAAHFVGRKGSALYSYLSIFSVGLSIFTGFSGVSVLISMVRHVISPYHHTTYSVMNSIANLPEWSMWYIFPPMFLFSVAMVISNIALLRHERPRLQNVLGLIIPFFVTGGFLIPFLLGLKGFNGSFQEYRIRTTLENTYATVYMYFACMLAGSIICGLMAVKRRVEYDKDYILVLGCRFKQDGTLTPLLQGRCDRAIRFWKEQKEKTGKVGKIVPSGGQGSDESMPEAEAMARYILSQGVPESAVLREDQSKNTFQNMKFSKALIEKETPKAKVAFSTTNYHVFRGGLWAQLAGLDAEGLGAKTKWWFWPNAFMRECVGLMQNRWREELALLAVMTAFFATLSVLLG